MEQASEGRKLELLRLKERRLQASLRQYEGLLWAKEKDLFTETRIREIQADLEKVSLEIAELL